MVWIIENYDEKETDSKLFVAWYNVLIKAKKYFDAKRYKKSNKIKNYVAFFCI